MEVVRSINSEETRLWREQKKSWNICTNWKTFGVLENVLTSFGLIQIIYQIKPTVHKKWSFPLRIFQWTWPNPQFPTDLVLFTEEITSFFVQCSTSSVILRSHYTSKSIYICFCLISKSTKIPYFKGLEERLFRFL